MPQSPMEAQIEAIVKAAVDKAVADTTERLTAQFEEQTSGLRKSRDAILAEKKSLEGKGEPPARRTHDRNGQPFDRYYTPEDEDRHLAFMAKFEQNEASKPESKPSQPSVRTAEDAIFITREAAADGNAYRAAREQAEAAGKPLKIVDDQTAGVDRATGLDLRADRPAPPKPLSLRTFEDRVHGVRYVRADQIQGSPIRHRMAAERDGLELRIVASLDSLDENGLAAYKESGGEA